MPDSLTSRRSLLHRLFITGTVTTVVDGLCASLLNSAVFDTTPERMFQGIVATLLGRGAFDGGTSAAFFGVMMNAATAFFWSAFFVLAVMRIGRVRTLLASRKGILTVAAVYGPFIWLVMSLAVIPLLLHRPPVIGERWVVQLFVHIPFVSVPLVAVASRGVKK